MEEIKNVITIPSLVLSTRRHVAVLLIYVYLSSNSDHQQTLPSPIGPYVIMKFLRILSQAQAKNLKNQEKSLPILFSRAQSSKSSNNALSHHLTRKTDRLSGKRNLEYLTYRHGGSSFLHFFSSRTLLLPKTHQYPTDPWQWSKRSGIRCTCKQTKQGLRGNASTLEERKNQECHAL